MLFNTLNFSFFLPVTFILYWSVSKKSLNIQNLIVLSASYFFYACWDWRFLFLLIFSTFLDYFSGIKIEESGNQKTKKRWFWFSILMNLSFLGFFKYYNFFIDSFTELISLFGFKVNFWTLKILLPVGISFYTFHGLSYVIDIYKGRIKSEKNLISYSVFVCFFPLLVAGPIERASHLLPQINFKRNFDIEKAINGLKQILWGLFKKVVIADNCATIVNQMFDIFGTSLLRFFRLFRYCIRCRTSFWF
jgi:alginate O-acetyltransferase complex protein AlgI